MNGRDTLKIHVGDSHYYFKEGVEYTFSRLRQIFRKAIRKCDGCKEPLEVFPGLVLRDSEGRLWETKLEVQIVPLKHRRKNNA